MKRFNLFCLLLLLPTFLLAQTTITGIVMAEGEPDPVIGANIVVKEPQMVLSAILMVTLC